MYYNNFVVFLYMLHFKNKSRNMHKFKQDSALRHSVAGVPHFHKPDNIRLLFINNLLNRDKQHTNLQRTV